MCVVPKMGWGRKAVGEEAGCPSCLGFGLVVV